jgi:hypothetical protein
MTHDFVQIQERNNLQARAAWERVASHRQKVTEILLDAGPRGGRLCLLGAGNCLDIDIPRLLDRFSQLTLVDIDPIAMDFGIKSQMADRPFDLDRVQCCAMDLCGWTAVPESVLQSLQSPTPMWQEILSSISTYKAPIQDSEPFDVVASMCILSQIMAPALTIATNDPTQLSIVVQCRRAHLDLMWKLAGDHGALVLITDFVATDSSPELWYMESNQLADKMMQLIREGNFFSGVNPRIIASEIASHPRVKTGAARVHLHPPWLWKLYDARGYLVAAFTVQSHVP